MGSSTSAGNVSWKVGGSTPTTVYGWLSSVMDRPIASADPNRRRQNPSVSSTTPAAPARSSAAEKPRPTGGATPSIGSSDALTIFAGTRSGSLPPASVIVILR